MKVSVSRSKDKINDSGWGHNYIDLYVHILEFPVEQDRREETYRMCKDKPMYHKREYPPYVTFKQ